MKQRTLTAVIAALLFIPIVFVGSLPFQLLVYVMATIGLIELLRMRKIPSTSFPGVVSILLLWTLLAPLSSLNFFEYIDVTKSEATLLAVLLLLTYTVLVKNKYTFDEVGFMILSAIYVGMGFFYLIETREAGLHYVFYALFVIWATDTGAYLFGRAFGKRKLWPEISPKKTVEGSVGGILLACVVAVIFQSIEPVHSSMFVVILVTILVSVFGQIGDLVESAYKRHYSVKDSGKILPGHGGVLDRFDSLIYILPILHFVQFIS